MIRNPKPVYLAILISFILSLVLGAVSLLLNNREPVNALILFWICFGLSFFVFFYTLEFYIYRKIKLIYKTIHSLKTKKYNAIIGNFDGSKDPILEMSKEVIQWAHDYRTEIDQLKRLDDFRKDFLGNVSHELKTPIFNIQGYIHTLIDGAINDPDVNMRFLQKAAKSADKLSDLVADLLTISELESGEHLKEMESFDINLLVKDVYEQLEAKAKQKNISMLIKEGCNKSFFVYADKYHIRQVLVNLLANSIKYGKENGTVLAAYYDMDENILIEIADNGEGIEQEHLPRVFERFYRVDKSRVREGLEGGTGLGLAIVKHIIEAHKQAVNVRSSIGVGTTFGFTLKKNNL